jgi:hypothetical protein
VIDNKTVYFGGSDVTISNGYPKHQNEEVSMDVTDNNDVAVWVIVASGTCELRILEVA